MVGSTQLAQRPPRRGGQLLNEFFRVVMKRLPGTVGSSTSSKATPSLAHLRCTEHPDGAGALSAARDSMTGCPSAGFRGVRHRRVGRKGHRRHIGAQAPLQYAVVGDPVNRPPGSPDWPSEDGHVLASARSVAPAALCWDVGGWLSSADVHPPS